MGVIAALSTRGRDLRHGWGQTALCVSNLVFSSKKILVFSDLSKNYARKLHFDLEVCTSQQAPSLRDEWM
jgi:hypothetical protein